MESFVLLVVSLLLMVGVVRFALRLALRLASIFVLLALFGAMLSGEQIGSLNVAIAVVAGVMALGALSWARRAL